MSRPYNLTFQLSDYVIARATLRVDVQTVGVFSGAQPSQNPELPPQGFGADCDGLLLRVVPIAQTLPRITRVGTGLRYALKQYVHCYVDLKGDFESYRQKFSSKTRSTIQRKVKKFAEHSGGELRWTIHRTRAELQEFFSVAAPLSAKTYQERLLDVGLPSSEGFRVSALQAADRGGIRAFILYDRDRPVSYLYCPVSDGIVEYAYLGFDPEYRDHSVGTVLQWLAFDSLFSEGQHSWFDFTEGESAHKRLFATHQQLCVNLMFVRSGFRAKALVLFHSVFNTVVDRIARFLDRWELRGRIRRFLRFGRASAA